MHTSAVVKIKFAVFDQFELLSMLVEKFIVLGSIITNSKMPAEGYMYCIYIYTYCIRPTGWRGRISVCL